MSKPSSLLTSPFMRPEIMDRIIALTDPPIPYLVSIHTAPTSSTTSATSASSAPAAAYASASASSTPPPASLPSTHLFTLIHTHCTHLSPNARRQRADMLACRLHILVNPSHPLCDTGKATSKKGVLEKAGDEVGVVLVRLELAVLALLPMPSTSTGTSTGTPAGGAGGDAGGADMAGVGAGVGVGWKEAESGAGVVNTECGHLIRRMERVLQGEGGVVCGGAQSSAESSETRQAWKYIRTALFLRGAALEVLRRVDEQYERQGRVKRWEEQILDIQKRLEAV